jgi:glycosyltransferase involved in cell wall biosynthesis
VVFNSHFHLQDFRAAARELLGILPRPRPRVELEDALAAARVIAPGIDLTEVPLGAGPAEGRPLRVLFPHRPEHDKRPHVFLAAAAEALARGAQLEFVCLGEGTGQAFATLPAENCVQRGRLACRTEYARLVGSCDVVVSTARHEFFGLAVAEALAAGCTPLLPRRQNYPDLIGSATNDGFHHCGLYETDGQLTSALVAAAGEFEPYRVPQHRAAMRALVEEHRVQTVAAALDGLIADMAASPKR